MKMRPIFFAGLIVPAAAMALQMDDPEKLQFFENKIRPLLIDHCYSCHSESAGKRSGSLLLDSKAGWMQGGDLGQVIMPGNAEESMLIHMVRHEPDYEAMPPKSKLNESQIADLIQWINDGVVDPRDQPVNLVAEKETFNLEERKQWWSFQPMGKYPLPDVQDTTWPQTDYDRFVLAKLEEKGWSPAPKASKPNLLRRLSFDLTGLAPSPEEMAVFLADESAGAYAKQVDRLLASPHFGEKWARHWMDLVRFAESKAFEMDYTMPHAYQYREYLIRTFNEDLPYDDFIREAIAGDLLDEPRINTTEGLNESLMGPGFIYLTGGQHGPPELHEDEARIFSDLIDTTSKSFLGLTVACARCHDHKFDAITTGDYYSWYGMLRSSRLNIANTVNEQQQHAPLQELKALKRELSQAAWQVASHDLQQFNDYIAAVKYLEQMPAFVELGVLEKSLDKKPADRDNAKLRKKMNPLLSELATQRGLDEQVLMAWAEFAHVKGHAGQWAQLTPLYRAMNEQPAKNANTCKPIKANYPADISTWMPSGPAFADRRTVTKTESIVSITNPKQVIQTWVSLDDPVAGLYSGRITGALRSPDFILDGQPIEFYARGKKGRISLIVRNYEQVGLGPTTKILAADIDHLGWKKFSIQTKLWPGQPAYIEILQDGHSAKLIKASQAPTQDADDAFISFSTEPPPDWNEVWKDKTADQVIEQLRQVKNVQNLSPTQADVLGAFFEAGLVRAGADRSKQLANLYAAYQKAHNNIPQPVYARSLVDGTPQDEPIYVRGHHKSLSKEPNPRRFLDALDPAAFSPTESGRREFAEKMADPSNPLTSRVLVNRLWHYLFGQGIVTSVDDFGILGTIPSHPELLDYMTLDFINDGWSIKSSIRKIVMSSTYQMSTDPDPRALASDPDNQFLQHQSIKRLEAEQIRDHILFCSGELKRGSSGPSVDAYTGDLPGGRGDPGKGILDGNGRRSVYLELRRNFMPSFLRVFGMPNATEPTGKRNITNVPAQALALMNAKFVHEQAKAWAERLLQEEPDPDKRIEMMHQWAFGRAPEVEELEWSRAFIAEVTDVYDQNETQASEAQIWQEFCHVIINRKEFIYLF